MVDKLTKAERSSNMSRIRGKDTGPELVVRSLLYKLGFRFRLHTKGLPGRPDIVMKRHRTIIFVHGCFWHRHRKCKDATVPKTRTAWWLEKLEGNAKRDKRNVGRLRYAGWRVLTIWECQTEKAAKLEMRLSRLLSATNKTVASRHRPAKKRL